jgi:uncharacterized protein YndB with AHSA1/START domain
MEGTLERIDGRYVVRIERLLAHDPDRVWRALTEPGELTHWFPADVSGALRPGAPLTFTFRGGEAPASTGEVLEVEPGRVFAYRWQAEVLRWEVHPAEGGCRLVFVHTFDDGPGAASFATGWGTCLDQLQARLSGREAPGGWSAAVHDRYVTAFGLDKGTTTTEGDAVVVRFVRQLTRPAGVVWPLLARADGPTGGALEGLPVAQVTAAHEPDLLAYTSDTDASGTGDSGAVTVRWELAPGPGGARATLTVAGPAASFDAEKAAVAAGARLDQLAGELRTS